MFSAARESASFGHWREGRKATKSNWVHHVTCLWIFTTISSIYQISTIISQWPTLSPNLFVQSDNTIRKQTKKTKHHRTWKQTQCWNIWMTTNSESVCVKEFFILDVRSVFFSSMKLKWPRRSLKYKRIQLYTSNLVRHSFLLLFYSICYLLF